MVQGGGLWMSERTDVCSTLGANRILTWTENM